MTDVEELMPEAYETSKCRCKAVVDLNWIFNRVLGYICAPREFRKEADFCKNGYVLKKDFVKLVPGVDQSDALIQILKELQVQ